MVMRNQDIPKKGIEANPDALRCPSYHDPKGYSKKNEIRQFICHKSGQFYLPVTVRDISIAIDNMLDYFMILNQNEIVN